MAKRIPPQDASRLVWRITAETPLGAIVDPTVKSVRPALSTIPDEPREANWARSSWDLLNGLEVTETGPGELFEDLFSDSASPATLSPPATVSPQAPAASEPIAESPAIAKERWILRFALQMAELDREAEPRHVIALAKKLWASQQDIAPAQAARMAHARGAPRRN